MTAKQRTATIELEIQSLSASRPTPLILGDVEALNEELAEHLQKKFGLVKVAVTRRQTLPVDPTAIVIALIIAFGTGAAEALGADAYAWLKKKLKGASVKRVERPERRASDSSKRKSTRR